MSKTKACLYLVANRTFEVLCRKFQDVALFRWPNVYDILEHPPDRYGVKKVERARDQFKQEISLDGCPAKFAKTIDLLYGKLEEGYGSTRHAMAVYERATEAVAPS